MGRAFGAERPVSCLLPLTSRGICCGGGGVCLCCWGGGECSGWAGDVMARRAVSDAASGSTRRAEELGGLAGLATGLSSQG